MCNEWHLADLLHSCHWPGAEWTCKCIVEGVQNEATVCAEKNVLALRHAIQKAFGNHIKSSVWVLSESRALPWCDLRTLSSYCEQVSLHLQGKPMLLLTRRKLAILPGDLWRLQVRPVKQVMPVAGFCDHRLQQGHHFRFRPGFPWATWYSLDNHCRWIPPSSQGDHILEKGAAVLLIQVKAQEGALDTRFGNLKSTCFHEDKVDNLFDVLQERIAFPPHPKTLTRAGDYEYFAAQVWYANWWQCWIHSTDLEAFFRAGWGA